MTCAPQYCRRDDIWRELRVAAIIACWIISVCWTSTYAESVVRAESTRNDVSFHREVMAVLTKAGCNAGRCHGNANGRGGFWLSLRGQLPDEDYVALTQDLRSRRVNRVRPESSLILLKATAEVPHEGGLRFGLDSNAYQIVRAWIAAGLPRDPPTEGNVISLEISPENPVVVAPQMTLSLRVIATWADGTRRDVTHLAIYEPSDLNCTVSPQGLVSAEKLGETTIVVRYLNRQRAITATFLPSSVNSDITVSYPGERNYIDRLIVAKWKRLHLTPAVQSDDTTFLRRLALDLTGSLPTAEEAREFAASNAVDKRDRWIERYLASPRFADHWALKWADLLRVEEKTMDARGVEVFHRWIRDTIDNDLPLDQFALSILTSAGSTYQQPPANFYRAIRQPDALAEGVAQVFLGTRLQCAKCHDHPFDRWTMSDYYGFAALFAPIDYEIVENNRTDKFDKNQFIGEQIVNRANKQRVKNPRTGTSASPRYLQDRASTTDVTPRLAEQRSGGNVDLESFAHWLIEDDASPFALVLANRIWSELLGRGLVEPVDDFRASNPPSHPELLQALNDELVANEFRLRPVVRSIVQSNVYQLASDLPAEQLSDERTFSHAIVRRLTAEQTLDALSQVTGVATPFDGYALGIRAGEVPGINKEYKRELRGGSRFLSMFGKPERLMTCACERSNETALNQVFELTSGALIHAKISASNNVIGTLLAEHSDNAELITELYWAALGRPPNVEEQRSLVDLFSQTADRRQTLEDILWALVNSKEFLFRR